MFIIIDNYDSFTYNLYQYVAKIVKNKVKVIKNDIFDIGEIINTKPLGIIISPGPKTPYDYPQCIDLVKKINGTIPILGVCLGFQIIAVAFGGKVVKANNCVHGKMSKLKILRDHIIFKDIDKNICEVGRYHSLSILENVLPNNIICLAKSREDNLIMAIKIKDYDNYIGIQFHPESILSNYGNIIIKNFIDFCYEFRSK